MNTPDKIMTIANNLRNWLLPGVLICLMAGCQARSRKMVPDTFEISQKYPHSVYIQPVEGGKKASILSSSEISGLQFAQAVTEAVRQSGLFKVASTAGKADYRLEVVLEKYDTPMLGLDFAVTLQTRWKLYASANQALLWKETLRTSVDAKTTDALTGQEKVQKAQEQAAKKAIKQAIKIISELDL